jgi:hypothetical protein
MEDSSIKALTVYAFLVTAGRLLTKVTYGAFVAFQSVGYDLCLPSRDLANKA